LIFPRVLFPCENQGVTNLLPLKWISSSRFGRIEKETWKFHLHFFFSFPCSFFLGVVTPLHLAHPDLLVSSNPLWCFQHLDRVLLVRKIFFRIQVFHRQLLFRHAQTFLQLRYIEYIMHVRQLRRQLQLVCYFTSLFQNLESSNEPRCELASNLETMQTPHRRPLEAHKISHLKAQLSSPMIGVAVLPRLCNSQVLPNHSNLLLGFLQNVGSKHLPFSSLTPKQQSLTPTTI
jgi:hypothetical protein